MSQRNERYEDQDEGEYHFSDEHNSYEVDTETAKVADATTKKSSSFGGFTRSRRAMIALAVFFALMFVVYKMLVPSTSVLPITSAPRSTTTTVTQTQQSIPPSSPAVQAPVAVNVPVLAPTNTAPVTQVATQAPATPSVQAAPVATEQQAVAGTQDKLGAIEQQVSKLANQLQIEYPQKMTDYENQTASTQAKLQELNTRVANIEAALTQITQLLQSSAKQQAPTITIPRSSGRSAESNKQLYSVQAIIPGRAWLKSDSGETVTVAEGDILRDYGRVTKIDPYDGVVDIDTGSKVISLSYGSGGD